MIQRRATSIRNSIASFPARRVIRSPFTITIVVAVLLGLTSSIVVAQTGNGDQVVAGNTGGTLSGVMRVGGSIIVVGGGNARSDLADLVGRSTVPWKRHIDLLILPGWDDQQPLGAIGLIERGDVGQVVIAGEPASNPSWTALQGAAARAATPVSVVSGHYVVKIAPDISVDLLAGPPTTGPTAQYAVVILHYRQSVLTFADVSKDGVKDLEADAALPTHTHVLVAMRSITAPSIAADVILRPNAAKGSDVGSIEATYEGEIGSGQHLVVHLHSNDMRLPLSAINPVATQPP